MKKWMFRSVALVVASLTGLQIATLILSFEGSGPTPGLLHAMTSVPLAAFFVFWYVVGTISAGLLFSVFGDAGLGSLHTLKQSNLPFYFLTAAFFGAFNAAVFLPLIAYLRTRSSILLHLFAVLIAIYASFVVALLP